MRTLLKMLLTAMMPHSGIMAGHAQQAVVIDGAIEHGVLSVDPPSAVGGQEVTLTVTPAKGYKINKKDITVEATIDPGSAQAPALVPKVGYFIDLMGEAPADLSAKATYTFIMPDSPYGVFIKAKFSQGSTAVDGPRAESEVISKRYVNTFGHVSSAPSPGLNIVEVVYSNGTRSVTKQVF